MSIKCLKTTTEDPIVARHCVSVGFDDSVDFQLNSSMNLKTEIDAIASDINSDGGGRILFESEVFDLKGENIELSNIDNIDFVGCNMGGTVFVNGGFSKNSTEKVSNTSIQNMTIDVNGVSGGNAVNINNNTENFYINRVTMKNTSDRFLLHWGGADGLIVENSYFLEGGLDVAQDNAAGSQLIGSDRMSVFKNNYFIKGVSQGGGLLTTGTTGNVLVDGNHFMNRDGSTSSYAGVSFEQQTGDSKDITVVNNHFHNLGAGFGVSTNTNSIRKIIFANNIMKGTDGVNARGGITVQRAGKVLIHDNDGIDGSYGIFARNCKYVNVHDNTIDSPDVGGGNLADKSGLDLIDNDLVIAHDNTVINNNGTGDRGIRVRTTPTGKAYIHDNYIQGYATSMDVLAGTNFIKYHDNDFNGGTVNVTATTDINHNNIP